eukprot:275846_1
MKLFIILTLLFHTICSQKSCTEIPGEDECDNESGNACKWYSSFDECRCISTVKLDILFAVDTSGSIGWEGFQIQKQFIETLVNQGVNNGSRIGFYMFDTTVNKSKAIQYWDAQELADYSAGLHWHRGWTNTGQVLSDSINQFKEAKATAVGDRQQILIMITDGNPCLPVEQGGCPQNICEMEMLVKNEGIRTIIIGVGDGLNTEYVDCLVEKPEDFIPVASFSTEDFNSIMGSLSGVLCPISKSCKFTEIKAMRRPAGWNENGDGRFTRFVEIYNTGVDFNAQELKLEGLVTMASGPDILVPQGSYLVFYDAADGPVTTDASTGAGPSIPSCHDCGSDCGLNTCAAAGQGTGTDHCFCDNAIYIACDNAADNCPANAGSLVDDSNPTLSASNGCSVCSFDNTMDKTNWYVRVQDIITDNIIDDAIYGDQGYWITTTDKFSYELTSKSFNNDIGDNWAQSCTEFGTPGANPHVSCDTRCYTNDECSTTGNNICQSNGNCYCDPSNGYYGQCTTKNTGSGIICTKCLLVPPIDDCEVHWSKNGTDRNAAFSWTSILYSGNSETIPYYKVTFKDATGQYSTSPNIYARYWNAKANFDASNTSFGGYVQACINNEIPLDNGGVLDVPACGPKTWCEVYTARPTKSPTPAPTDNPTFMPSNNPTDVTLIPTYGPIRDTYAPSISPILSVPLIPTATPVTMQPTNSPLDVNESNKSILMENSIYTFIFLLLLIGFGF